MPKNSVAPIIAGVEITTDSEGRFNLNALHRASGLGDSKKPSAWLRTQTAKELIAELEAGNPAIKLINTVKGRGITATYAHELLAVSYAGWISAHFQLQVNQVFLDYKMGGHSIKPKTTAEAFLEVAKVLVEHEQRLSTIEVKQQEVEQAVGDAHKRLDQIQTATEYFTISGYAKRYLHRYMSRGEVRHYGRFLSRLCREFDIEIGTVPDERWGEVNTYPKDVLDAVFDEVEYGEVTH